MIPWTILNWFGMVWYVWPYIWTIQRRSLQFIKQGVVYSVFGIPHNDKHSPTAYTKILHRNIFSELEISYNKPDKQKNWTLIELEAILRYATEQQTVTPKDSCSARCFTWVYWSSRAKEKNLEMMGRENVILLHDTDD